MLNADLFNLGIDPPGLMQNTVKSLAHAAKSEYPEFYLFFHYLLFYLRFSEWQSKPPDMLK
jgi:hypothetical protein